MRPRQRGFDLSHAGLVGYKLRDQLSSILCLRFSNRRCVIPIQCLPFLWSGVLTARGLQSPPCPPMNWNCSPSRRPKLSVFVSLYCVNLLAALSCAIVLAGIASQLHCNWMLVTVTSVRPIGGCLKGAIDFFVTAGSLPSLPVLVFFNRGLQ